MTRVSTSGNFGVMTSNLMRAQVLQNIAGEQVSSQKNATDLKGYAIEASYGLTRNTWLSLEWDSADAIDRPPFSTDVVLFDVNARF